MQSTGNDHSQMGEESSQDIKSYIRKQILSVSPEFYDYDVDTRITVLNKILLDQFRLNEKINYDNLNIMSTLKEQQLLIEQLQLKIKLSQKPVKFRPANIFSVFQKSPESEATSAQLSEDADSGVNEAKLDTVKLKSALAPIEDQVTYLSQRLGEMEIYRKLVEFHKDHSSEPIDAPSDTSTSTCLCQKDNYVRELQMYVVMQDRHKDELKKVIKNQRETIAELQEKYDKECRQYSALMETWKKTNVTILADLGEKYLDENITMDYKSSSYSSLLPTTHLNADNENLRDCSSSNNINVVSNSDSSSPFMPVPLAKASSTHGSQASSAEALFQDSTSTIIQLNEKLSFFQTQHKTLLSTVQALRADLSAANNDIAHHRRMASDVEERCLMKVKEYEARIERLSKIMNTYKNHLDKLTKKVNYADLQFKQAKEFLQEVAISQTEPPVPTPPPPPRADDSSSFNVSGEIPQRNVGDSRNDCITSEKQEANTSYNPFSNLLVDTSKSFNNSSKETSGFDPKLF